MRRMLFVVWMPLCGLLAGCLPLVGNGNNTIVGSGTMSTREYPVEGFNAVAVDHAFGVTLTRGEAFKVSVTTDDNLLEHVVLKREGDTLRISMHASNANSFRSTRMEANVTLPLLTAVQVSGAVRATMSGFEPVPAFRASLSGASRLHGPVRSDKITLEASGASQLGLTGSTKRLDLGLQGASSAELGDLAANEATLNASGASRASLKVKSRLSYDLSGASRLSYTGEPVVAKAHTSGASSVNH